MIDLTTEAALSEATLRSVAETLDRLGQKNQASECRTRADALSTALEDMCDVCGKPLDTDADFEKFDDRNPVVGDELAYHLGCEDGVFDEIRAEVAP